MGFLLFFYLKFPAQVREYPMFLPANTQASVCISHPNLLPLLIVPSCSSSTFPFPLLHLSSSAFHVFLFISLLYPPYSHFSKSPAYFRKSKERQPRNRVRKVEWKESSKSSNLICPHTEGTLCHNLKHCNKAFIKIFSHEKLTTSESGCSIHVLL